MTYNLRHRGKGAKQPKLVEENEDNTLELCAARSGSWRRILLLVFAITLHNIPEGLAVGVGFGSLHTSACSGGEVAASSETSCSFESAFNLALGIGIQNFPEGTLLDTPERPPLYDPI